ncbi:MAG TPA: hypothetical protein VJ991_06590 [Balneolales bacterium]|nr:hypothetical protein [Balneolales bacterium]
MIHFNDFLNTLKKNLGELAKEYGSQYKDAIIKDGTDFALQTHVKLDEWLQMVVKGQLTKDDLEYLLEGQKDLMRMETLKNTGLAIAQKDKLQRAMLETVAGSILKMVP